MDYFFVFFFFFLVSNVINFLINYSIISEAFLWHCSRNLFKLSVSKVVKFGNSLESTMVLDKLLYGSVIIIIVVYRDSV